jgi:glycosyltransferase involved in cell wall biosynthesis
MDNSRLREHDPVPNTLRWVRGIKTTDIRALRPTVMFIGLRGIGDVQGGVETHVTELVRHLPYSADQIEVIGRSPYRCPDSDERLPRVRWLPTLRQPQLEALIHSVLSVGYAAWRRPRLLHIHGIGPSLVTPLAQLLGLRVVSTHHGNDYEREKWGALGRAMLRWGERQAMRANACISISPVVADQLRARYRRDIAFIPNGVSRRTPLPPGPTLAKLGLESGRFIVNVARFVPEKRQLDLIKAFERATIPNVKLVLVGSADHNSAYGREVLARADANPAIRMTGFLSGPPLAEVFSNAGLFALPSAHEGLPIALLEAMAYGRRVLVSDLPIYKAMGLPDVDTFPLGDINALAARLGSLFAEGNTEADWTALLENYHWGRIAHQTAAIYNRVLAT